MPVIDAHQHLWDTTALHYPEFDGDPELARPFRAADYDVAAAAAGITGSVCVEAASAGAPGPAETCWLLTEAGSSQHVLGVVAWAPVGQPGLRGYLAGLAARPGRPVVGIRRGFKAGPATVLADPAVRAGVRAVGTAGLPFDLLISAAQREAAVALVRDCPETVFVLDHLGSPPSGPADYGDWCRGLAALAGCDQVYCKLSGVAGRAGAAQATTIAMLREALGLFGPSRAMFASDWPVSTGGGSGGLTRWVDAVATAVQDLPAADQARVFGGTARAVYGLTDRSGV